VDVQGPSGQAKVMMLVWDIMGQKGFRELLREAYFFGAHGAIAHFLEEFLEATGIH